MNDADNPRDLPALTADLGVRRIWVKPILRHDVIFIS